MATVGALDLPSISVGDDNRRTRELYRYVEPDSLVFRNLKGLDTPLQHFQTTPSLSSALRPFVQFAALRCGVQRAFVSVVDNESQYFLSEASRILDVGNEERFEDDEQLLWLGCGGVAKEGKLCQGTLALPKATPGEYPFYILGDLLEHPKYSKLPFVSGEPHFRFYAGTPLTTKNGIRIGSFCVMDTRPRADLSREERNFLGNMADQTMAYLEINRDALEGRRSRLMSSALHRFVQGKSTIVSTPPPSARLSITRPPFEAFEERSGSQEVLVTSPIGRDTSSNIGTTTSGEATDTYAKTSHLPDEVDESRSHPWTMARAANLLREALEIDDSGGVLFLEATNRHVLSPARVYEAAMTETDTSGAEESSVTRSGLPSVGRESKPNPISKSVTFSVGTAITSRGRTCPVQASSTAAVHIAPAEHSINKARFGHVDADFLADLLQRYPRGKLWVFDADGSLMSSDDDRVSAARKSIDLQAGNQPRKGRRRKQEAEYFQKLFPGSRQLLFAPLWDAGLGRWFSGCFCWSGSDHRTYSTSELAFTSSYVKSVMAECNRLNTLMSDKQKGDFISSVSHELRSPLHGILASAEFLGDGDNNLTIQQRNLVETIEACGRTLLDTINHVLDFSKINTFEQSWKKDRRSSTFEPITVPTPTRQLPNAAPPLLRLYAHTDIAAIAEEVVEGLCMGRLFGKHTDLTDVSVPDLRRESLSGDKKPSNKSKPANDELVDVLLDIEKGDWQFVTQPGALRRVIMNLVGNSLKYTASGSIKVRLRQESLESVEGETKEDTKKNVILTVADTGKGISPEYLQSKLFMPFAQEDTLTPGTGLGLSIVRSIVTMLAGTIDVQSTVGKGTTMTVVLPVLRPSAATGSDSSNPPSDSTVSSQSEHIHPLREIGRGKSVAIYSPSGPEKTSSRRTEWRRVISTYVRQWFELDLADDGEYTTCDLLVVDEQDLSETSRTLANRSGKQRRGLIVLCNNSSQQTQLGGSLSTLNRVVEYVTKPCGPYKLARAFRSCLERMDGSDNAPLGAVSESSPSEQLITDFSEQMQEMELDSTDKYGRPVVVQTNENITVKETSRNAQMALSSPFYEGPSGSPSPEHEFPFPDTSPPPRPLRTSSKQKANTHKPNATSPLASPKSEKPKTLPSIRSPTIEKRNDPSFEPHVLLVDDNAINLRLLQTFMKKRKYTSVDSAENGALAVQAVQSAKRPYDIIFMDISMPVMNGFEATRAIREYEESQLHTGASTPSLLSSANPSKPPPKNKPAMIIALTGLASGRDQSEGFASGIDIYMTKPVSFKEVSKFLDNWEINRRSTSSALGSPSRGRSPSGAEKPEGGEEK